MSMESKISSQMTEEEYLSHSMPVKTTSHIRELMQISPAIARQYDGSVAANYAQEVARGEVETAPFLDSLEEDNYEREATKGVVAKYDETALIKVSYICAAHCGFCTRTRQIGTHAGDLSDQDIKNIGTFFFDHPKYYDVLFSGGDPLANPVATQKILEEIRGIDSIKVIRFGTRAHHHAPALFHTKLGVRVLETLSQIKLERKTNIIFQLNFQHPDEITLAPQTQEVIEQLQARNFETVAQIVFLKGINNSYPVMSKLCRELHWRGVRPYYLYHCDKNIGIEGFECDYEEERDIYTQLLDHLPGPAVPQYVIDVPGRSKSRVPSNHWDVDRTHVRDSTGKTINL